TALDYFSSTGVKWLDIGSGPGLHCDGADGLSRFKRGWSTTSRMAYFCGRILNRPRYLEIAGARPATGTGYFPAYREGEFA
ncbi:MAG: hypothetical protein M1335_06500, partial [Chloroflexi bacterium]|nr:hypothetical protein [Chloroflexota bacterium]